MSLPIPFLPDHAAPRAGAPGGRAATTTVSAGGTISQMLDERAAERRALSASFRIRAALRALALAAAVLIGAALFAVWAVHLVETSARNLALDLACFETGCW